MPGYHSYIVESAPDREADIIAAVKNIARQSEKRAPIHSENEPALYVVLRYKQDSILSDWVKSYYSNPIK